MDMPHIETFRALLILEPVVILSVLFLVSRLQAWVRDRVPGRGRRFALPALSNGIESRNAPLPARAEWKQLLIVYGFALWVISWLWRLGVIDHLLAPLSVVTSLLAVTLLIVSRERIALAMRAIARAFESRRTIDPIDTNV